MKPLQESVTSCENKIYKQINEQMCAPFIYVAALRILRAEATKPM